MWYGPPYPSTVQQVSNLSKYRRLFFTESTSTYPTNYIEKKNLRHKAFASHANFYRTVHY